MPSPKTHPTAREWIAALRAERGYDRPFLWSPSIENLVKNLPPDVQPEADQIWRSRVGRSMASILDEQFENDLAGIRPALDSLDSEILESTPITLYPSYDFQAFAGSTPYGDPLLAVHTGLPHTLLAWSHAFVRYFERGGTLESSAVGDYVMLASYLADVWEERASDQPAFRPKTSENYRLAEELANASLCFVVAHEIGHVRLRHTDYTDDIAANHAMEFAADRHGLTVAARYALLHSARYEDSYFLKFMLFAPHLTTTLMSLFGDEESNTHPSAAGRLEQIASAQPEVIEGFLGDQYSKLLDYLDHDIFQRLANNARGLLSFCGLLRPVLQAKLTCQVESPHSSFRRT